MAMPLSGTGRVGGDKTLVCGVCQEIFRSPRLLPCFHTFCLYCVEGLIRTHGRVFSCPQCRKPTAVPREGALGFQRNFYITDEELEREGKGASTAVCPTHPMEPLVFFCVQCDLAICIRCKLTKHQDHGETEDLSAVAARSADYLERSKDRLDNAITLLTNEAKQAKKNLQKAEKKGAALKVQVKMNRNMLVQKVDRIMAKVLDDVDTTNLAIKEKLTQAAQSIEKESDSLVQLRHSLHHALSSEASDADKVDMEKEMRKGEGSEEHICIINENIPTETYRPGVQFDISRISPDDINEVLGSPVTLSKAFNRTIMVPAFR